VSDTASGRAGAGTVAAPPAVTSAPAVLVPAESHGAQAPDFAGENQQVADALREMATLLDAQGGNPYRAAAYRRAADTVAALSGSVRTIFERDGLAGLDAVPAVGPGIAAAIAELLVCGHWRKLERLRGDIDGGAIFRTIPGVGEALAQRLHDELGVDTLEALEVAAHDGRLERLPRLGARRAAAIRSALTALLDRDRALRRPRRGSPASGEPPLDLLLEVDKAYRSAAQAGTLPTIAPRRFNPQGLPWLPVMHTQRGGWQFTALYSNTARAHELDRVHDWVVVYAEDGDHAERQYTVVTARSGALADRRVVRGREAECAAWYARR